MFFDGSYLFLLVVCAGSWFACVLCYVLFVMCVCVCVCVCARARARVHPYNLHIQEGQAEDARKKAQDEREHLLLVCFCLLL